MICRELHLLLFAIGLSHPASKNIYCEIDEKLQKWYKFMDIALVKVLPLSVIVTKSMTCFIMYSTTDSVNVFELPIPGRWWEWEWTWTNRKKTLSPFNFWKYFNSGSRLIGKIRTVTWSHVQSNTFSYWTSFLRHFMDWFSKWDPYACWYGWRKTLNVPWIWSMKKLHPRKIDQKSQRISPKPSNFIMMESS